MYYIYHIPGIKVGCTTDIVTRVKQQNFTDYEVLEEHVDIYLASEREIELQKQYGYPVDTIPYWKTIFNANQKKSADTRKSNGYYYSDAWKEINIKVSASLKANPNTIETCKKAAQASKLANQTFTDEEVLNIRNKYYNSTLSPKLFWETHYQNDLTYSNFWNILSGESYKHLPLQEVDHLQRAKDNNVYNTGGAQMAREGLGHFTDVEVIHWRNRCANTNRYKKIWREEYTGNARYHAFWNMVTGKKYTHLPL